MKKTVRQVRQELDYKIGEARSLELRISALKSKADGLKDEIDSYDKAVAVLNSIAEDRQNAAQLQIESLVTRGLQTIFGPSMSFHLIQSVKGERSEVDFVLRTKLLNGNIVETDVMHSNGGGLSAVVGFLLRVVVQLLSTDETDNLLKLDEIFAHLSKMYVLPVAEFIKELVDKTDIRILMVTHQEEFGFIADKLYSFKKTDGFTEVREIKASDI